MYYPLYNTERISELMEKSGAKVVMFNSCDVFPCPIDDYGCETDSDKLIRSWKEDMELVFSQDSECNYYILSENI